MSARIWLAALGFLGYWVSAAWLMGLVSGWLG